ncbi:MAG: hypothetical protein WC712_00095 [Candidatus Brocadiia bacterium]
MTQADFAKELMFIAPHVSDMIFAAFGSPLHPELFGGFSFASFSAGGLSAYVYVAPLRHLIVFTGGVSVVSEAVVLDSDLIITDSMLKSVKFGDMSEFTFTSRRKSGYRVRASIERLTPAKYSSRLKGDSISPDEKRIAAAFSDPETGQPSMTLLAGAAVNGELVIRTKHFFGLDNTTLSLCSTYGNQHAG